MVIITWEAFMDGKSHRPRMEVTILLPCLNEENTVAACVRQAAVFLKEKEINGEVLVCDNGSEDASVTRAKKAGARVVSCKERGYGNTLLKGMKEAYGDYIIMGDCDCSYHFDEIMPFLMELRKGADLVVGDRFMEKMERGAMPLSHRFFGVPILSFLGRVFFGCRVKDFHCGLRAVKKESFLQLKCCYQGMEFATEMIGRAALEGQKISQVPVKLYCDKRGRNSHLWSIPDGIRHLRVILSKAGCEVF